MSNSASDESLIKSIVDTFENTNLTDTSEKKNALDEYYSLMIPVVSTVESGNGFNSVMNIKMKSASDLIDSLMKIGYSDRIDVNV